jgi:phosphohistidine phosphatase
MHQLLLLRHAKSARAPALPDHARPLSPEGEQTASAMARAMRNLGLQPDLVLVSSARRTLQTLERFEPWDETPLIEPTDALYMATAPQMLKVLNGIAETVRSALLLGHNPGVQELALLLIGGREVAERTPETRRLAQQYPTAALAEFAIPGTWQAQKPGGALLVRFLAPADLSGGGA